MHSEDAVAFALLIASTASLAFACTPKGPSPTADLEGQRVRRGRDASTRGENDDEEDAREDREAVAAGISIRALSCSSDRECLTHRCDVAHERCRFPCRDDGDCQAGARCEVDAGDLAACFAAPR